MSQELERVNHAHRNKSEECVNMEQSFRNNYEQTVGKLTRDNEELNKRLREAGDIERKRYELENKVVVMAQELERLQENLKAKQD